MNEMIRKYWPVIVALIALIGAWHVNTYRIEANEKKVDKVESQVDKVEDEIVDVKLLLREQKIATEGIQDNFRAQIGYNADLLRLLKEFKNE